MVRTISILLALLAITACNSRFNADFEGDQVGAPPPSSPPGPPADQILLQTSGVSGNGMVVSVTDNPDVVQGNGPHRFMSIIMDSAPGQETSTQLRSAPFATSTQPLFLVSDQVIVGLATGNLQFYGLPADDLNTVSYCRIRTGNDVVTASCAANVDASEVSASIDGFDSQRPHRLVVRIDRPAGPVRISVSQDGIEDNVVTLSAPNLQFPGEGAQLNMPTFIDGPVDSGYLLNSVSVSERDPG